MVHTSVGFFQRETASTVINAIVFEVNQILNVLLSVMVTLVRDSLTVFFLLGYLFYLNWKLTLIVAVMLPAIGWLIGKINRRLRRLNRENQMLTNELSYIVEETVGGYKVVKVHNGEQYETDRFTEMSRRLRGYSMRMTDFRRAGAAAYAVSGVDCARGRHHDRGRAIGDRTRPRSAALSRSSRRCC